MYTHFGLVSISLFTFVFVHNCCIIHDLHNDLVLLDRYSDSHVEGCQSNVHRNGRYPTLELLNLPNKVGVLY